MKLILFDIDGTLIWPDGSGRLAMNRALIEVVGTAGPADSLPMAGKTDWQIITELLTAAGLDRHTIEARLPACFQAIARHMAQTVRERLIQVCPGVSTLLARLSAHPETTLGLLTGNLAATAPIKLRAANLNPALFLVGAYGSDAPNRSQLPGIAVARAQALTDHTFRAKDVVIVGDTPADVTCGRHLEVTAIGVATGHHSLEAISAAGADHVFPDLTDTDAVMRAMTRSTCSKTT
jgi:phosphoglycolate phosphatase-like HAD superfamily hydrolase